MSRCKCGKKLSKAELTLKDPQTGEYLDYCSLCLGASEDTEVDCEEEHAINLFDVQDDISEETFDDLMDEITDLS